MFAVCFKILLTVVSALAAGEYIRWRSRLAEMDGLTTDGVAVIIVVSGVILFGLMLVCIWTY